MKETELTAIAFAEWIIENRYSITSQVTKKWYIGDGVYITSKELWIKYTKTLKV